MTSCQPLGSRVTRRAASSRGGGPPSPPEEAKAPRWDACSREAQRLLGIQLRLVGQLLGYSGRVRERFRHRSSKFIARAVLHKSTIARAHENKVHLQYNVSLKASALFEMSISLANGTHWLCSKSRIVSRDTMNGVHSREPGLIG